MPPLPPTEEEWIDIDRPANEEDFGNGGNFDDVPDLEDFSAPEEFFPPTEEEWLDIDRPADEKRWRGCVHHRIRRPEWFDFPGSARPSRPRVTGPLNL